ncbi:Inner membrane protein YihY, formerly thought to be RNase BN [Polaromonas sp. CG9_12]|nr:Inner membrane protein YihY, formerly thought to be RNase BN [Polaromonas sp. CG9_12]
MNLQHFYQLVKKSVVAWIDDYAPSMGAAISYYTVFSIAPLMIIVIAVAGFVWGREAVQGEIVGQLSGLIGQEGAQGIQALIESANQPTQGLVATAISIVVLVIGATTVFAELQSALDRIWRAPKAPQVSGIWAIVRSRLLSLGFILGLGFLLLVSLVSGAALAAFGTWVGRLLPGWEKLLFVINIVFSIGIATVLFAMIFKVMPQVKVGWRDVWTGAFVTAVLFEVGKWLISLYIGKSSVTSSFAAAGSLVVLLVWVYYSAQIFLLGAEFTWVFANEHGSLAGDRKPGTAALPSEPSSPAISEGGKDQPVGKVPDLPCQSDLVIIRPFSSLPASLATEVIRKESGHPSLKQRAIVYAGSAAACLALRLLLKRKSRGRIGLPGS